MLHDLGKGLYVPSEILNKPGKLTQIEMSLIKTHPQVRCEVLQKIEMFSPMAQAVLQHHERLDGSGYPQGLRENEIRVEAMIIAMADVVEAMSSHRPYCPALGLEAALNEIKQKSGRLYRPEVVEACLRVFEKGFSFD
ncbi:MAG: HD-GYP domain-containing protein [Candidatus Aminicenantales bacterium]